MDQKSTPIGNLMIFNPKNSYHVNEFVMNNYFACGVLCEMLMFMVHWSNRLDFMGKFVSEKVYFPY